MSRLDTRTEAEREAARRRTKAALEQLGFAELCPTCDYVNGEDVCPLHPLTGNEEPTP